MQHSVISRPGTEKSRIPHFLYIDEFPPFVCKATEDFFTLFRKYRVGLIISAQNLSQLGASTDLGSDQSYRQTILANCTTKIVFGNNTPEDNEWWSKEFGEKREWKFLMDYNTKETSYESKYRNIEWSWKDNYKPGKIQSQKFKAIIYKTRDIKGKMLVGKGKLDFLESKYKEKHNPKKFNFSKYTEAATTDTSDTIFNEDDGPIKYNQNDVILFLDNDSAITYNIDKK